jgi:hypothetical protein
MKEEAASQLGHDAQAVLDNRAFQEAMKQLHDLAHAQFKKTDIRDAEGLKLARQFAAVTDDFENILRRIVEGGKVARLVLEQHRDENRIKRFSRKISG